MGTTQTKKSFAKTHPHIASQLVRLIDRPGLTAHDITYGVRANGEWDCGNPDHPNYEMLVKYRTSPNKMHGCPYCSGQRVCASNCLASVHPHLVDEWDYDANGDLTPYDVTAGSEKRAHWACQSCDYRWDTEIQHRTSNNSGCPYCNRTGWPLDIFRHWVKLNWITLEVLNKQDQYQMMLDAGLVRCIGRSRVIVDAYLRINGTLSDSSMYAFAHNENSSAITKLLNNYDPRKYRNRPGFTPAVRRVVFERDNYTCQNPYCCKQGIPEVNDFHVDHIYPWIRGGSHEIDNFQTLCQSCNTSKCDREWDEFLMRCAEGRVPHISALAA